MELIPEAALATSTPVEVTEQVTEPEPESATEAESDASASEPPPAEVPSNQIADVGSVEPLAAAPNEEE